MKSYEMDYIWLPTYWSEYFGVSVVRAGAYTALYSLSSSLLRVVGGMAADRFTGERVASLSFLVVVLGAVMMMGAYGIFAVAMTGQMLMALGMGFANAAVFKLVPHYTPKAVGGAAGIVGGLGAFGGFVIPPAMGLYVKFWGTAGYPLGFSVFLILSLVCLGLFLPLKKDAAAA